MTLSGVRELTLPAWPGSTPRDADSRHSGLQYTRADAVGVAGARDDDVRGPTA